MRLFEKYLSLALVFALTFSIASCSVQSDLNPSDNVSTESTATESVTESSVESESSVTTSQTESTTVTSVTSQTSVSSSETLDSETTSTTDSSSDTSATSPDGSSSLNECSFSPDKLLKASKKAGVYVYKDVDKFIDNYNKIAAKDKKAVKAYRKGAVIKVSGDDIDKISSSIGNSGIQNGDFMSHATDLTLLMAGDVSSGACTIVAISYEVDDPSVIDDWFKNSVNDFENNLPDSYKSNENFNLDSGTMIDGDVSSYLMTFVINKDIAKEKNIPKHAGVYMAAYAQGTHGLMLTVIDFSEKKSSIKIMDSICKSMKIHNPKDVIR